MIDSHTHLDHLDSFDDDSADEVIMRAKKSGVYGVISIGCEAESIKNTIEIACKHPDFVRVSAGVHPINAARFKMENFAEIRELARDPLVVAIGEAGFDQHHDCGTLDEQMPAFLAQCELARELDLPLIIHSRAAAQHTIAALDAHAADLKVILHCYSLTQPDEIEIVKAHSNWVCSFAGNITYPSAQDLRDAASSLPLDRLMVETDAPYLSPKKLRGKRNEPSFVQHALQTIADEHNVSFEEARRETTKTATRVFKWTPSFEPEL